MMKRPWTFYLVVTWCCLGLLIQMSYLSRPARVYQQAGEQIPTLWHFLPLLGLVFAVWQTLGLLKLRIFHRWFAVVFFIWWSVSMLARLLLVSPSFERPIRIFAVLFIFSTFNFTCAWYLARRSFREFAVKYVTENEAEKKSRLMRETAQKMTEKEIQRSRHN